MGDGGHYLSTCKQCMGQIPELGWNEGMDMCNGDDQVTMTLGPFFSTRIRRSLNEGRFGGKTLSTRGFDVEEFWMS